MMNFSSLLRKGQFIFTDRYFTTLRLARFLLARGIYLTGPFKKNISGFPSAMLHMTKTVNNPRGSYTVVRSRDEPRILAFSWHDSGILFGLTTGYEPFGASVQRRLRRGDEVVVPAPPAMAIGYNPKMGGTDLFDRIRGGKYHTSKQVICRKWFLKLWTGLFGCGMSNAWLLCRDCVVRQNEQQTGENHYDFLRELQRQKLAFRESGDCVDGDRKDATTGVGSRNRHQLVRLPDGKKGRCAATSNCLEGPTENGNVRRSSLFCSACGETYHAVCFFT